jgi:hypothetical protein
MHASLSYFLAYLSHFLIACTPLDGCSSKRSLLHWEQCLNTETPLCVRTPAHLRGYRNSESEYPVLFVGYLCAWALPHDVCYFVQRPNNLPNRVDLTPPLAMLL